MLSAAIIGKAVTQDELLRLINEAAADGRPTLDLAGEELNELPPEIGKLTRLKTLVLGRLDRGEYFGNNLKVLPNEIGQLTSLQLLSLDSNQLSRLPESITQLTSLRSLDLSANQLSSLPESIAQLSSLQSLDLGYNQLSSLPKWAKALEKLEELDLRGNPLPISPEILGQRYEASETLDFYFSLQAEEGSIPLYEAKLILVGEGGAGKTSLAKKIVSEDYELAEDEKSTEGIDVIRWDFPMGNGDPFRTNIWDFGGQEIYHATHQFFLTKRSLYLLVADTRPENTDFYYWLKIIELLSDNSPVIIIKNEKQDRQCEIDEGYLRSQFNNLKDSFAVNLANNRGLDKVKEAIRYHISQLPHVGHPLPKIWVRARAALENYAQNCNTITLEKYCDICRQNGFTDRSQMLFLSSYLHDLGVCLHFQDDMLLERTVILKPEWATTAVYKVADSDTVRHNKGRFTNADIAHIWRDREYSNLRPELLNLMMRFKLAYELPHNPGHYIAPQLLPISQPAYDWDTTDNLILRYRYDFMPKGIVTRFIVETHRLVENQDHVWKNGVVLADSTSRAQIIENYSKSEIHVSVSGSYKKPLLERIRYELWKIHQSYERLVYQELIPCNCEQCKGSPQPESYAYELLTKYVRDRRYEIECRKSYEKVDVRRLISDITDQTARFDMADQERAEGSIKDPFMRYLAQPLIYNDYRGDRTTNQYGKGDNVGNNKIEGDSIDTQINNEQDITRLSDTLDALIEELSEEHNHNKPKGQANIQRDALNAIRDDPNLKQRITNAFKAGFDEDLKQSVKNPLAKILIQSCKGFLTVD